MPHSAPARSAWRCGYSTTRASRQAIVCCVDPPVALTIGRSQIERGRVSQLAKHSVLASGCLGDCLQKPSSARRRCRCLSMRKIWIGVDPVTGRVSSFSLTDSSVRAASHSSRETTSGRVLHRRHLNFSQLISFATRPRARPRRSGRAERAPAGRRRGDAWSRSRHRSAAPASPVPGRTSGERPRPARGA
jgi:hypothetical protein